MFRGFRNAFLTGLLILLPLGITVFILTFLIQNVGAPASKLFFGQFHGNLHNSGMLGFAVDMVAMLLVVIIITVLGYISRYFFGRFMIRGTENIIERLPFIRTLYRTSKQIIGTFAENKRAIFQKAVLVQFPREGIYSVGFLTGEAKGEIQTKTQQTVVSVFVPTTPNPTSGFLLFLAAEDVIELEMSVADALKAIISAGVFVPNYNICQSNGELLSGEMK